MGAMPLAWAQHPDLQLRAGTVGLGAGQEAGHELALWMGQEGALAQRPFHAGRHESMGRAAAPANLGMRPSGGNLSLLLGQSMVAHNGRVGAERQEWRPTGTQDIAASSGDNTGVHAPSMRPAHHPSSLDSGGAGARRVHGAGAEWPVQSGAARLDPLGSANTSEMPSPANQTRAFLPQPHGPRLPHSWM